MKVLDWCTLDLGGGVVEEWERGIDGDVTVNLRILRIDTKAMDMRTYYFWTSGSVM